MRILLRLPTGNTMTLDEGVTTIGRAFSNAISVPDDPRVSRQHAEITCQNGHATLYDRNSLNGTFVNGERVNERELKDGDVIRVGRTRFYYIDSSDKKHTS